MKKKSFELINSIKNLIIEKNLLKPKEEIILAFSGGQDSIFVLLILFILKKQWDFEIKLIHCNHLWQKNSLFSYFHISKIAFCLNLEIIQSIQIKNLISEEQSRYWRLKNFDRINDLLYNYKTVTGHTQTDQIETFFFNTLRGSGITGSLSLREKNTFYFFKNKNCKVSQNQLKNFYTLKIFYLKKGKKEKLKKNIYIIKKQIICIKKNNFIGVELVRPLIKKNRFDTKNICENWKLPLFTDHTNQLLIYSRNRLRKEFLPICRFYFNTKVDLSLYKHTTILFDQEQYLNNLIKNFLNILITEEVNGYFFNISLFFSLPISLQRKICFLFFKEKLKINYTLITIDSFIVFTTKFFLTIQKTHKNDLKKNIVMIFFPEIGIIYFSKTLFMFLK